MPTLSMPSVRSRAVALLGGPLLAALLAGNVAAAGPMSYVTRAESATVPLAAPTGRTSIDLSATYDVNATLGFDAGTLRVDSTMTLTNTSGAGIERLELNALPARLGSMDLGSVTVNGAVRSVTISDQTIHVPLGFTLAAGGTATVRVVYDATFRRTTSGSNWLFAKDNGIVDAYRWIPWVSREVDFDRPNFGDPFVTPVSPSVIVRLTSDRPVKYATSGRRISSVGLTQTFRAENVRDFNFTASPHYQVISSVEDGITYRVYYRSGFAASSGLTWAKRSLARMADLVGAYPYPTYTIGQSAGGYGMESPSLTWIPTGTSSSSMPYLISHETGHQFFYGVVGNDQAAEPYADEAPADFLARYTLGTKRSSRCAQDELDRSIYAYSSGCYYEVIYIQGGNFLDKLRLQMGSTDFWAGMRAYYAAHRYDLGGTRELLDTLDDETPSDLTTTFEPRFPRYY